MEISKEERVMEYSSVNTIWVLLGAALVFFMQAGFAMCEAGFTRAKNTGNGRHHRRERYAAGKSY